MELAGFVSELPAYKSYPAKLRFGACRLRFGAGSSETASAQAPFRRCRLRKLTPQAFSEGLGIQARALVLRLVGCCLAADVLLVVGLGMVQLALPSKQRKALASFALEPKGANMVRAHRCACRLAHLHGPLHVRVGVEGHG